MRRITVNFSDSYFNHLQESARDKGISLAHYARGLIDFGRQVEEATAQSTALDGAKNKAVPKLDETKELWKNSLLCVLESRYLLRYLVDNLTHLPSEKRDVVLNVVKEKAQSLVTEWISHSTRE